MVKVNFTYFQTVLHLFQSSLESGVKDGYIFGTGKVQELTERLARLEQVLTAQQSFAALTK